MKKIYSLVALFGLLPIWAYAQPGVEWVQVYSAGTGLAVDNGAAVETDAAGNVYVTGSSVGGPSFYDIVTLKYDVEGNELWLARYNGPGNGRDDGNAIAVDADGNIYVTGSSWSDSTSHDFTTIKYDTEGNELWVARYNGPANSFDRARAIKLDVEGNVYVGGESIESTSSDHDYLTVKYSNDGQEQWVARYAGSGSGGRHDDFIRALAIDAAGNVYVAGLSQGLENFDYALVKYNTDGEEQWVGRYNGPGNTGDDEAYAVELDAAGNIYLTGWSRSTLNVDIATLKYDANGTLLWSARFDSGGDRAWSLAVDAAGNAYIGGLTSGPNSATDFITLKYNTDGVEQWRQQYNGPGGFDDVINDIVLDAAGDVYVTGNSSGQGTNQDYATIKYDADGNEQWVARYNGPANEADTPFAMALDASGNLYLTGKTNDRGESFYMTLKYGQMLTLALSPATPILEFSLSQNYPNPVGAHTAIAFTLPTPSPVSIRIYDLTGQLVSTLVEGAYPAGHHEATWNAQHVERGVYMCHLRAGPYRETKKLELLGGY